MVRVLSIFAVMAFSCVASAQLAEPSCEQSEAIEAGNPDCVDSAEALLFQYVRLAPQDSLRQCYDSCLDNYKRPGAELKNCVATCKKQYGK